MFKLLLKLRLKQFMKSMTVSSKKEGASMSKGKMALFGFLFIYVVVVFAGLFFMLSKEFSEAFVPAGLEWLLFAMLGLMVFMLCFMGSIFITQNQLFEAKDNDLLFSMPINQMTILSSRLIAIVLFNYLYEAIVFIPAAVGYFTVAEFDFIKVLIMLLIFIMLPLLAVVLSVAFAWLIAFVSSKSRWQSFISTGLKLVSFAVYMFVMMQLQQHIMTIIVNGEEISVAIRKYLIPFYFMGNAVAEKNIVNLILFALICIVPTIIAVLFLSKNYIKIATSKRGGAKRKYTHKAMKTGSMASALFKKELKSYTSSSIVMMNSGLGQILLLVFAVYAFVKRDDLALFIGFFDKEFIGAAICGVFILCLSTVIITSSSISLEANTLWLLKSLPVSAMDIFLAKIKVHVITSLPFIAVSAVIMLVTFDFTITGAVMLFLIPIVYTIFTAIAGLLINLKYPKFDWTSEAIAVKQGLSPFIAMLVGMASAVLPAIIVFFLMDKVELSIDFVLIIVFAVYVVLTIGLYVLLDRYGNKTLRKLN